MTTDRAVGIEQARHRPTSPTTARHIDVAPNRTPVSSPETVIALQRLAGNRAVTSLLTVQRGRKNRNRGNNRGSKKTGGTAMPTVTVKITTDHVKGTAPVVETLKESKTPNPTPTTSQEKATAPEGGSAPEPSSMDWGGEITGNVAGGVLDVWEGLETAGDSSKDPLTRGTGAMKVGGGTSSLIQTLGKEGLGWDKEAPGLAGKATETFGLLGALGEGITTIYGLRQEPATEKFLDTISKLGGIAGGAIKTLDAYLEWSKDEAWKKLWMEGRVPGLAIVSAAMKIFGKLKEMWDLSSTRQKVAAGIAGLRKRKRRHTQQQYDKRVAHADTAEKVIEALDSKWYRSLVDVISAGLEISGELLKWGGFVGGWITGNVVGSLAKVVPLSVKLYSDGPRLYTRFKNWIWGTGVTTAPSGGSVVVRGEWDDMRDLIKTRKDEPFGQLLMETVGLKTTDLTDDNVIESKLKEFAG